MIKARNMGKTTIFLATVCSIILVVVFFESFVFQISTPQNSDSYFTAYYNEFKKTPTLRDHYTFSPPVSLYHAQVIALQSGGWNASALQNMEISAGLDFVAFRANGGGLVYHVISQPADWGPIQVNDTTYRYVWTITVYYSGGAQSIPPPGYYYVDAATAELVPVGIL